MSAERDGLYRRGKVWWLRTDPLTGRAMSTGYKTLALARRFKADRLRICGDIFELAEAFGRFSGLSEFVYFIRSGDTGLVKVGYTCDVKRRLSSLGVAHIGALDVLAVWPGDRALELRCHRAFGPLRVSGEWFREEYPLTEFLKLKPPTRQRVTLADLAGVAL